MSKYTEALKKEAMEEVIEVTRKAALTLAAYTYDGTRLIAIMKGKAKDMYPTCLSPDEMDEDGNAFTWLKCDPFLGKIEVYRRDDPESYFNGSIMALPFEEARRLFLLMDKVLEIPKQPVERTGKDD